MMTGLKRRTDIASFFFQGSNVLDQGHAEKNGQAHDAKHKVGRYHRMLTGWEEADGLVFAG